MEKDATRQRGYDKKAVSRDLPPSAAPLLGEDEMIYRALQIMALRAERCAQQGALTPDAAAAIKQVLASVDGVKQAREYLEHASQIAQKYNLPQEMTLTGVIEEIRAVMEVGKLGKDGNEQQLFRLVSGLSGITHTDGFLKALSFCKGRMLWATLRLLRDPDDGRRGEWLKDVAECAESCQIGVEIFFKKSTLVQAEADLTEALTRERERRG
jgi:hypothetical protein